VHEGSNRRPGDLWGCCSLDGGVGSHLLDLGHLGKVENASENSLRVWLFAAYPQHLSLSLQGLGGLLRQFRLDLLHQHAV
jgi:hypothetical protein